MRTFLLLSLAALALGASARPQGIEEYISGGEGNQNDKAKYAVEVLHATLFTSTHMCTGALIDKQWVLSTYSCLNSRWFYESRQYVLGKSASNPTGKIIKESKVFWHEAYDKSTGANNIALVQLAEPVPVSPLSPNYGIAYLPVYNERPKGHALLAGFGQDSKLKTMELTIVNVADCSPAGSNPQLICTEKGEGGACTGDEGSPLAMPLGSRTWKLVGLATGDLPCQQPTKMGQYLHVAQFSNWANNIILQNS